MNFTGSGRNEVCFIIAASMRLCFGFVTETVLIPHWDFDLLSTACTVSRLIFYLNTSALSRLQVGKKSLRGTARTADLGWPKMCSVPSNVMLSGSKQRVA